MLQITIYNSVVGKKIPLPPFVVNDSLQLNTEVACHEQQVQTIEQESCILSSQQMKQDFGLESFRFLQCI